MKNHATNDIQLAKFRQYSINFQVTMATTLHYLMGLWHQHVILLQI